jgi:hypothetical protein
MDRCLAVVVAPAQGSDLGASVNAVGAGTGGGVPEVNVTVIGLVRNVEIPAHETRVLHSAISPDGQMLATTAADEYPTRKKKLKNEHILQASSGWS